MDACQDIIRGEKMAGGRGEMKTKSKMIKIIIGSIFYLLMKCAVLQVVILLISLFIGYLTVSSKLNSDSDTERPVITGTHLADIDPEPGISDILEANNISVEENNVSWQQISKVYIVHKCPEDPEKFELIRIKTSDSELTRTKLDLNCETEHMLLIREQPYVDEKDCLHILFRGYDPSDGKVLMYWLCTFDDSGELIEKNDYSKRIHNITCNYYPIKEARIFPGSKIEFIYDTYSGEHWATLYE